MGAVHAARLAPSGAQRPMEVAATDSAAAVAAEGPVPTAQLQVQVVLDTSISAAGLAARLTCGNLIADALYLRCYAAPTQG